VRTSYSRYGSWSGLDSLTPARDSATVVMLSVEAGNEVALIDRVASGIFTFIAAAVPTTTLEFATLNPHVSLAATINTHPLARLQYIATAGLTSDGQMQVDIQTVEPSLTTDLATLSTTGGISVVNAYPGPGHLYTMWGGAKVKQSSLAAGGEQTIDHTNAYNPLLGMVALGGSVLPLGGEINLILVSSRPR